MPNIHHAEMTLLVKREKELQRKLESLRDDFGTWKERVELAKDAGRDELAEKALGRIQSLRGEARSIKSELQDIVEQKKELRKESKMPTGQENRRAEALLRSFKESGLVDPDEAQLQADIEEASKDDDAALDALKAKAGVDAGTDGDSSGNNEPGESSKSASDGDPDAELDAELAALRAKMGDDTGGGDDDIDLGDLERELADDD